MQILSEKEKILLRLAAIKKEQLLIKLKEDKEKIINLLDRNLIERSLLNVSIRNKSKSINDLNVESNMIPNNITINITINVNKNIESNKDVCIYA